MLEWLKSIGDFLSTIITFIISFFQNVIEVCVLVFKGFAMITEIIIYLPVQYQAILLAIVSFCVIVTIIHFGG